MANPTLPLSVADWEATNGKQMDLSDRAVRVDGAGYYQRLGAVLAALANGLNVANFGAVGDGIADDSAAWSAAIAAAATNQTIVVPFALNKVTAGVLLNKRVRIVGIGREQCEVSGFFTVTDDASGACLEDMNLKDPTSALFVVSGRGGLDFKRCLFNPGAGKFVFQWDNAGQVPLAMECIQCHMNSGRLITCAAGGVQTYPIHIKEVSLFNFTENDQLTCSASNYAECLTYQSLINVSPGVTRFATTGRGLITCRQCLLDDQSATSVYLTNGTGNTYDTYDVASTDVMQTNGTTRRFVPLPTLFGGDGVTGAASPSQASITTGTLNLSGANHNDVFFITGNSLMAAAVTYALSAGLYPGQRKTVIFTGTHTCSGFALNLFGILHGARTLSVGPCRVELYWDGAAWQAWITGRSRFSGQETGTQNDVADTSGAALGALETSVNQLKAVVRAIGGMR